MPARVSMADPVASSADRQVDGGPRSAPASLPCVLRAPLQLVFYDLLSENDGFVETIRKGAASMALGVGILLPLAVVGNYLEAQEMTVALAVYMSTAMFATVASIVTYLVVRWATFNPATVLGTTLVINSVMSAVGLTATMEYPFHIVFVLTLPFAALLDLPMKWAWILGSFLPYCAASYNHAARSAHFDHPPLLIPNATATQLSVPSRLGPYVALYFFATIISLVFYAMHAEYARSIERSKASATLAKEVARLLAGYDTASARDALRFAEVADAELSEALEAIVENLEAYRPHLPNWLVNAAACASSSGKASENDTDTADEPSTNFDSRSDVVSGRSHRSAGSGNSHRRRSSQRPAAHAPADTIRTLTVVRARIGFRVERVTGDLPMAAQCATAFVDAVHAAARHTKAAVHSFIGDTVEVSWNAAAPAPSAKAKCARFLARVRQFVEDLREDATAAHLSVGGGAIACRGKVLMAGHGKQHQALLLSIGEHHEQLLSTLAHAGARHRAMLADAQIAAEALDVRSFPVATVAKDGAFPADSDAFVPVHQVLSEFAAAADASGEGDGHADWLYELQQRAVPVQSHLPGAVELPAAMEGRPMHVVMRHAFEAACGRRYAAAVELLSHVRPEDMHANPLVARFAQAVRRATTLRDRDDGGISHAIALAAPMIAEDGPSPSLAASM